MRKTKKLLSIMLSAAMVATALPATAFAADVQLGGAGGNINGEGTIIDGLVYSVVVPTDLAFTVNPLKFGYTDADGVRSTDQIISTGYGFANTSSVPVQLDVKVQIVTSEGITIATAPDQIKDSTNEDPTIYLQIEPADAEPEFVSGSPSFVSFGGLNFVSGPALSTAESTISFKMNKANYDLEGGTTAVYQNNNLDDDTVGFRFGGKVSTFSAWDGLEVGVSATYAINGISEEAFASSSNNTPSDGYNVLNTNLLATDPYIEVTRNNTLTVKADSRYITEDNEFNAHGLFFVMDQDAPIDLDSMSLTDEDIVANGQNGGYQVFEMSWDYMTYDPATGVIEFNAAGMDILNTYNCVFFIKLQDKDGNMFIAHSVNTLMAK